MTCIRCQQKLGAAFLVRLGGGDLGFFEPFGNGGFGPDGAAAQDGDGPGHIGAAAGPVIDLLAGGMGHLGNFGNANERCFLVTQWLRHWIGGTLYTVAVYIGKVNQISHLTTV